MFNEFLCKRPLIKIIFSKIQKHSDLLALTAVLQGIWGLRRYRWELGSSSVIYISQYENEKRVLQSLMDRSGIAAGEIEVHHSQSFWTHTHTSWMLENLRLSELVRFLSIVRIITRRHSALIALRQIHFLMGYSFFNYLWRSHAVHQKTLLGSSESNPEILAPLLSAQASGAKAVYVNHGQLDSELGIFTYDRAVVTGAALESRVRHNLAKKNTKFLHHGASIVPLQVKPWKKIQRILILSSITIDSEALNRCLLEVLKFSDQKQVSLRLHPNEKILNLEFQKNLPENIRVTNNQNPLSKDLQEADIVIAGETSSHLEALLQGIPSIYFRVDKLPFDHYGFIDKKLIPHTSTLEGIDHLLTETYSHVEWVERLQYFVSPLAPSQALREFILND